MLPGLVLACASSVLCMREITLRRILLSVGKFKEGWISTLMPGVRIVCVLVGQRLLESAPTAVGKEAETECKSFEILTLNFVC